MSSLTTRQRDIIKILLDRPEPIGAGDIADSIHLSARQVTYCMKGVERWLTDHGVTLQTTPGVGISVDCAAPERSELLDELENATHLQLILTPEERHQLLYFFLLIETNPVIVSQLSHLTKVSSTTILNDLNTVEEWLVSHELELQRRQNYGMWIEGAEQIRQQVIAQYLWEGMSDSRSLFSLSFHGGLKFALAEDVNFLPLVKKVNDSLTGIDFKQSFNKVVLVENLLGGRFTDEAVLVLTLVLIVLYARHAQGQPMEIAQPILGQLQESPVWDAANKLLYSIGDSQVGVWSAHDIAYVAMYILSAPRHESWPSELNENTLDNRFVSYLLEEVSKAYGVESLKEDLALRDSLINLLIPVCNRHQFRLWFPQTQAGLPATEKYDREHRIASRLSEMIRQELTIDLSEAEQSVIASLLRAAYIRLRTYDFKQVLVVCPSGMATAQLLIARLKTRFPRLGTFTVTSYRNLDHAKIDASDLVITMMPLPVEFVNETPVIQVSPQLLPEDVDAITSFLS